MTETIIDILGWIGSLLIVCAYWLISSNRVKAQSIAYQLLNILGIISLLLNTFYYSAYPSSTVNAVWLLTGLIHITSILKNNKSF